MLACWASSRSAATEQKQATAPEFQLPVSCFSPVRFKQSLSWCFAKGLIVIRLS